MDRFPRNWPYLGRFEGRVVDGPKRGQMIAKEEPYFRAALYPRMSVLDFNPDDYMPERVTMPYIDYVWSWSLEEWCLRY